jgi:hypothetical protein
MWRVWTTLVVFAGLAVLVAVLHIFFPGSMVDLQFHLHVGATGVSGSPAGTPVQAAELITVTRPGTGNPVNVERACRVATNDPTAQAAVADPDSIDGIVCVHSIDMYKVCPAVLRGSHPVRDTRAAYGWKCVNGSAVRYPNLASECRPGRALRVTPSTQAKAWRCTDTIPMGQAGIASYCHGLYPSLTITVTATKAHDPWSWTCGTDIRTAPDWRRLRSGASSC